MKKLDITIAVPGLPFDGSTIAKQSLGGSETAGYYVARELAAMGHFVTCFTNCETISEADGVLYMPLEQWARYVSTTPHDICIIQRAPEMLRMKTAARLNWLWCHDLALGRSGDIFRAVTWALDAVLVLSKFMAEQYKTVYGAPDELLHTIRNGVDLDLVDQADKELAALDIAPGGAGERDHHRLVYMARPERGLDVLLEKIFPLILERDPKATLHLCAYANPVPELAPFLKKCDGLRAKFGDRVVDHGALSKKDLYKLMLTAGVYVYPTPSMFQPMFKEVSCIALMEAQACGLPIVSSNIGALPETMGAGAGVLIDLGKSADPWDKATCERFASEVIRYTTDRARWDYASKKALSKATELSWAGVAKDLSDFAEEQLRDRSSNPVTMAHHFYKRSDIFAMKAVLAAAKDRDLPANDRAELDRLAEVLADKYAFTVEEDGYRKQYEKIGATHDARVIDWAPHEPRYAVLKQWLGDTPSVVSILDYGCAHGGYATNLLKDIPGIRITGVDIDKYSIAMAEQFAETLGVTDRFHGVVGTHETIDDLAPSGVPDLDFDCVVAQEVLEHVAEPWKVIERLEAKVKDGGWVYLSVPIGPWEYSSFESYPHRCHVWEFDCHDIREMLQGKKAVSIAALGNGGSPELGDLLGWWVIKWQVRDAERGAKPINMERKLWVQAPRQTVSATIIAGPNCEETLHWHLRSIQHVYDQLIIVDCGLSDEAKRILSQYPAEVVPGVDPKMAGFETPRNMGIEYAWGDYILWLDTDEKMLDGHNIGKYLRRNMFNGYSIHQHHFAIDTAFSPDIPVRLFRRNSGARFFGMIHEHPEREINQGVGHVVVLTDVHIAHVGYLAESGRKLRFARNLPLLHADREKYPERLLQKVFVMRDNMIQVGYMLTMTRGQLTQQMIDMCHETCQIYRDHFLGKSIQVSTDPSEYYWQAMKILGEGFEVEINLAADKNDAKLNGGAKKYRFRDKDEMDKTLLAMAGNAAGRFLDPYW